MSQQPIRFDDGEAYERGMGAWSRLVAQVFLDWLALPSGLRWADIGCGNGAFTEVVVDRCAPDEMQGIDPSEAQLAFARLRPALGAAAFRQGDAMELPFADAHFDAAVMALVIFFVPDPAKGVAEMVRIVRPGGVVAAYAWDMFGGGFPFNPIHVGMRAVGLAPPLPPSVAASRMPALRDLWTGAGLKAVETREITVRRKFADFEDFWNASTIVGSVLPALAKLAPERLQDLKARVRGHASFDSSGGMIVEARANAIKGRVP